MDFVWIIHQPGKNEKAVNIEHCDSGTKQFITLKPFRPVQVPALTAMEIVKGYHTVYTCPDPEKYFQAEEQKILIQRDGGIGDLLLLEPVIRQMKTDAKREISALTMNSDVYEHNPNLDGNIKAMSKESCPINLADFDNVHDYRDYSEKHPDRMRKHRTDIYAGKTGTLVKDKNPRLYFGHDEKNTFFIREPGKTYIGLALDGSHSYRRYDRGVDLMRHVMTADPSSTVVLFGSWDFMKVPEGMERVIDLQKKTTVRQMILAVKDLDYLISVDTGIMHVGMALHVPTVGIFSICSPEYRVTYYDGPKRIIRRDLPCKGCGDEHMSVCKHGDKTANPDFIPPCMDILPDEIYRTMTEMQKGDFRRVFWDDEKIKTVNVNIIPGKKLVMPVIVLNEEANLPRFVELVMSHKSIGKVIAIDGGSTDRTVELLEKAGAEVHVHPYLKTYPEQQAMQRNISCSYVPDGQAILIMDIDECFSKELSDYLPVLAEQQGYQYALLSRRTFLKYEDITDPAKQIKSFPDWQPRYYLWDKKFKFIGGPHHRTVNTPPPVTLDKPILHFEDQNGRRVELESQWKDMDGRLA